MKSNWSIPLVIVCLLAATCLARPPKVVKMVPENGAADVKPGPNKIRILFDQDMNRGGYSICGGGENFPEFIGKPKWTGKRSIVVNVNLKPNHEYTFGINSPSFKNFRSVSGEPAEVLSVTFRTCGPDGPEKSSGTPGAVSTENRKAVEALRENIRLNYSYRDRTGLNWDDLFDQYEQKLLEAESPEKFVSIAKLLLGKAKDKHIWFEVNGESIRAYRKSVTPNANFQALPKIVPNFKNHNKTVSSGRFPDGIGYLAIHSWASSAEKDLIAAFSALEDFSDTRALIIDVRANGGGSEPLAKQVAGCFIDEPKLYAKHISVDRHNPGHFTDVHSRYVRPNEIRPKYRGKIAVLVGPVVMSSCEAFVLMMKQVPGCVIVGETTQGSSGNPKPYDLGNGVTVYLPSWQTMLPDGTCFEGKGIRPDILIKTTPDQITTSDPVINAARKALTQKT